MFKRKYKFKVYNEFYRNGFFLNSFRINGKDICLYYWIDKRKESIVLILSDLDDIDHVCDIDDGENFVEVYSSISFDSLHGHFHEAIERVCSTANMIAKEIFMYLLKEETKND
jgi:hypothetical protein